MASIVICGPLLIASGVAAALQGFEGDIRASIAVGASLLAGVLAYSTTFTWAGLVTSRALAFGLL